ncbi:hypothetical protein ACLB2K_027572 [Fragaria x ananassa]
MSIHDPHQLMAPADSNGTTPAKEQQAAGVGILLQIMMLVLSFVLGHVLRRHKFYYLPEASASLLIGPGSIFTRSFSSSSFYPLSYYILMLPCFLSSSFPCNIFLACMVFLDTFVLTQSGFSLSPELGTDTNLYALVFGESVLNDAMAISLYRTMSLVRSHASSGENFFMVIVRFLETFVGSMSAGKLISNYCLSRYMLAEGLGLSGIVSILFTGMIFIGVARAANVFSCAYLVNLSRPAHRQIPVKHQKALWYSGLRGAMAFALALQSVHDLPEGHGQTIFTATTAIVVLTVLLIGGSTGTMLEALQVVGDGHESTMSTLGETFDGNHGYMAPSYEDDEEESSGNRIKMKLKELHKSAASFTALDRNYLTPFFTSQNGDEAEEFGKID